MHNIKDLRKNLDSFKKKLKDRNLEFDVDKFNKLDELNRKLISDKEKLEQEKKSLSKSKDKSNFNDSKKISSEILVLTKKQKEILEEFNEIENNKPDPVIKSFFEKAKKFWKSS